MPLQTKWSTTAADNDDSDISVGINWAENMAPSQVNDSARAEMAEVAKLIRDLSGAIATAGTSTAYTAATAGSFDALADGVMVVLTAHTSNGASPQLTVTPSGFSALAQKKIRKFSGNTESDLAAGEWPSGYPGMFRYKTAANGAAGAWVMLNPASTAAEASVSDFRSNVADKTLTTDVVWSAADWVVAAASSSGTPDMNAGLNFSYTTNANFTLNAPTNTKPGQSGVIEITMGGAHSLSVNSVFKWTQSTTPTFNTSSGGKNHIAYCVVSSSYILATLHRS